MNYSSIASLSIAIAVLLGAFGSHGLEDKLDAQSLKTWQTAVLYQLTMSIGLLVLCSKKEPYSKPKAILSLGILSFCGSLYLYVLTEFKPLVYITPLGGLMLISAWLLAAWKMHKQL